MVWAKRATNEELECRMNGKPEINIVAKDERKNNNNNNCVVWPTNSHPAVNSTKNEFALNFACSRTVRHASSFLLRSAVDSHTIARAHVPFSLSRVHIICFSFWFPNDMLIFFDAADFFSRRIVAFVSRARYIVLFFINVSTLFDLWFEFIDLSVLYTAESEKKKQTNKSRVVHSRLCFSMNDHGHNFHVHSWLSYTLFRSLVSWSCGYDG